MQDLLREPKASMAWYNGEVTVRSTHKFVSSERAMKKLPGSGLDET
jgi:hypothetical protein